MDIKNGLTDEEVLESREKNGSNIITNKKRNSFIELLISSLGDPIIRILIIFFSNFKYRITSIS